MGLSIITPVINVLTKSHDPLSIVQQSPQAELCAPYALNPKP